MTYILYLVVSFRVNNAVSLSSSQHAVQQLFHPDQHSSSIKTQVCDVVYLICTTVHQIHAVFYTGNDVGDIEHGQHNMLMKTVAKITDKSNPGELICPRCDMQILVAILKQLPFIKFHWYERFRPLCSNKNCWSFSGSVILSGEGGSAWKYLPDSVKGSLNQIQWEIMSLSPVWFHHSAAGDCIKNVIVKLSPLLSFLGSHSLVKTCCILQDLGA